MKPSLESSLEKIKLYFGDDTSTPIGTVSADLAFSSSPITGTVTSSGTWTAWTTPYSIVDSAQERRQIWNDMWDLLSGKMELSSEDIESLIELITIHGEELGKLRFILNRRDLAAL